MTHFKNTASDELLPDNLEHLELAKKAAQGETPSRQQVNELAHEIISYQTGRFCKRYCRDNRYRYICTLVDQKVSPPRDAVFCEWGNASYGWMLDDLTKPERLRQYSGANGARLNDYFYAIANSLPFYERWKDWRFGRKVHVPTYIKDLFPDAAKIFYALRAGNGIQDIAQKIGKSENETEEMCHRIIILLTQKRRLHLLDPPSSVSLTQAGTSDDSDDQASEMDIPWHDESQEKLEFRQKLLEVWEQLSVVEQYVIEAMVIENQDAEDVLNALKQMDISIKPGVAPEETNRQQLYYYRRKILAKMADLIG